MYKVVNAHKKVWFLKQYCIKKPILLVAANPIQEQVTQLDALSGDVIQASAERACAG